MFTCFKSNYLFTGIYFFVTNCYTTMLLQLCHTLVRSIILFNNFSNSYNQIKCRFHRTRSNAQSSKSCARCSSSASAITRRTAWKRGTSARLRKRLRCWRGSLTSHRTRRKLISDWWNLRRSARTGRKSSNNSDIPYPGVVEKNGWWGLMS